MMPNKDALVMEIALAQVAKLSPKAGDVLVIRHPEMRGGPEGDALLALLSERLRACAPGCFLVLLPPGWEIQQLTDEQLAAVGLARRKA